MGIDWTENVLAFDVSFVVFHQYYSALKGLVTCTFADVPGVSEVDGKAVRDRKLKAFETKLHDTIVSKANVYDARMTNVCFLLDCPRNQIWRKTILPAYKESRIHSAAYDVDAFKQARDVVLPVFVKDGAMLIYNETSEADDLAAGLARAAHRFSAKRVTILTGDSDFAQLVSGPVHVHDLTKTCLLERQGILDPSVALLRKILAGDKSDNISAVKPRLGHKTASSLASDPEALSRLLTVQSVRDIFERNTMLIDLSAAPRKQLESIDRLFDTL